MSEDSEDIHERLARIEEREIVRDKKMDAMAEQVRVMYEAFVGTKFAKALVVTLALVAGFFIGLYRDALGIFK